MLTPRVCAPCDRSGTSSRTAWRGAVARCGIWCEYSLGAGDDLVSEPVHLWIWLSARVEPGPRPRRHGPHECVRRRLAALPVMVFAVAGRSLVCLHEVDEIIHAPRCISRFGGRLRRWRGAKAVLTSLRVRAALLGGITAGSCTPDGCLRPVWRRAWRRPGRSRCQQSDDCQARGRRPRQTSARQCH